ncbi:hypothetical protein D3C71_1936820 [compost metagenome]
MAARLQRQHAVVAQPRRAAPHHHVAVRQRNALGPIATLHAAELEYRRQPEGNGDDRRAEIMLVFVLMQ